MTVFVYVNTSKQGFATTILFVIFILGIGTAALLAGRQVRRRLPP